MKMRMPNIKYPGLMPDEQPETIRMCYGKIKKDNTDLSGCCAPTKPG
jgi:hypothetical protein